MAIEWVVAYLALGAVVGFMAGLLGIGGGGIMVPILTAIFAAQGTPPDPPGSYGSRNLYGLYRFYRILQLKSTPQASGCTLARRLENHAGDPAGNALRYLASGSAAN